MNNDYFNEAELNDEDIAYIKRVNDQLVQAKVTEYLVKHENALVHEKELQERFQSDVWEKTERTYSMVSDGYQTIMRLLPTYIHQIPVIEREELLKEVDAWNHTLLGLCSCKNFITQVFSEGKNLQEAFHLSNGILAHFYGIARMVMIQQRFEEAGSVFYLLAQLNPNVSDFWVGQAACYQERQMYREAVESYQKAKLLNHEDPTYLLSFVDALLHLNEKQEAEELLHEALSIVLEQPQFEPLRPHFQDLERKLKTKNLV